MILKTIKDFDNYEVSSCGVVISKEKKIRSKNGSFATRGRKVLKQKTDKYGYKAIQLTNEKGLKSFTVHRLVAAAFIPNPKSKPQINHINGIKTDNRIENLEWCTHKENVIHAYKNGLNHTGENHHKFVLSDVDCASIISLSGELRQADIASIYNVSQVQISRIINGKSRTYV